MRWSFAAFATLLTLLAFPAAAESTTTAILVRHAEKAVSKSMNPDVELSQAGLARAAELARVMADVPIAAIYTTPFERTRRTVAPLAAKLRLEPVEVSSGDDYAAQMAKLIRDKHAGQVVLVVGHSNTTPQLIRALGGEGVRDMPDSEYDNLYLVTLNGNRAPAVLRLHYGAENPKP